MPTILIDANHKHVVPFPQTFPLTVHSYRFTPDSHIPENFHDYLEVSRIDGGGGALRLGDAAIPVARGDVILMGPDVMHTIDVEEYRCLQVTSLYFLPEIVYAPGEPDTNFEWLRPFYNRTVLKHPVLEYSESQAVTEAFQVLVSKQNEQTRYRTLEARIQLLHVLLELVKSCDMDSNSDEQSERRSSRERLDRVVRWMNENFHEQLTLDQAATVACMSPQAFCRFFRRHTGHTFTGYLSRVRVACAKQMLLTGRLRVADIAYEVGFGSQSYFFRVFREITGSSPGEFSTSRSQTRGEEAWT